MTLLDGKSLSQKIFQQISVEVQSFKKEHSFVPGLAVILIGDNPASEIYVKNKIKACKQVGFHSVLKQLPASTSKTTLKKQLDELNANKNIHGILVQLPLPSSLNEEDVLSWIDPKKDVDGLTMENKALLWSGSPRVVPCTPQGVMVLLKHYKVLIEGKQAVVIGRSQIVGLPMFQQLTAHQATVTLCHSYTKNLSEICKQADIVVACAGKKRLVGKEDFKKGAAVVDVGIHRVNNKLFGDVRAEGLENHLFAFSPVPGGVGPMTIAMLIKNGFQLAKYTCTDSV